MKNKLWICAGAALLLVAAGERFFIKPVLAQVRAAFIKNIDEKGRVPYQVTLPLQPGTGSHAIDAPIPPVPAGKRLVLEYVNASLMPYANYNSPFGYVTSDTGVYLVATLPINALSPTKYIVNTPVLLYLEAGQSYHFRATEIDTSNTSYVTLTGYLVDLSE